jgi:glyoxylase-like metal-dependent hydrolase (beta-lactamase superfamily II)
VIEEIGTNLFRVEVPLPPPLAFVNSYILKGSKRSLIIDTGMRNDNCLKVLKQGLSAAGVKPEDADIFVTHAHIDHFGLFSMIAGKGSILYIGKRESMFLDKMLSGAMGAELENFLHLTNFPEKNVDEILPPRHKDEYLLTGRSITYLEDGDMLPPVGEYRLRAVTTPGHSKGHVCLYEPEKRILFSGDHILFDITPGISLRTETDNPLCDYLQSLSKVEALEVDLVLPGHREVFKGHRERITQLKVHHEERVAEVLATLGDETMDAYQMASLMTWSITDCEGWESWPLQQQFFATGEAFAHLRFLEVMGLVKKERRGRAIFYSRA